jgi:cardiolipin synthase
VPNAFSFVRLLGVPLFLWLVLAHHDWWALGLLTFAGLSDWLDGKLARLLDQTSRLGTLLDPAADRLYILATLIGLTVRDIVPLWVTAALVAREIFMGFVLLLVRRHGYGALPVHFVGKAATMALLYAFPLLLLGDHAGAVGTVAKIIGWSFTIWGTALYWWAAALYAEQAWRLTPVGGTPRDPAVPGEDHRGEDHRAEDPKGATPAP